MDEKEIKQIIENFKRAGSALNKITKTFEQFGAAFAKAAEQAGKAMQEIAKEEQWDESWKVARLSPLSIDDQIDFHFLLHIEGWQDMILSLYKRRNKCG